MSNLSDVCNCLSGMDSSKATERKKNATQLELLLDRESVVDVINDNTTRGTGNRVVTWDVVLKGVNRYIDTEIAALQSAKESKSATTLNNRDKKKQELTSLFKLVIRLANKGNAKLSFQLLLDRIESILTDTYTLESFGADYCQVFLKDVLRVRRYWLKISPDKWRKLIILFCKLYDENKVDQGILARIIPDVMHGCCLQGELYPRRVFSFFTRVLKNIRELKDTSVIENILISLNIFCKAVAPNSRVQLCCFGESQMNGFISLWGRHTDKIKEELVEFLHLLVRAHHPDGVADPCNGAYADDWELWKKQVTFLHEIIVTDIDKITDRYKFTSGSKVITPAYIAFAADVFKQMPLCKLVPPDFIIPSSQASQLGNHGDGVGAGPAKRARLCTETRSLLEIVNDRSNTLQAIPWLQLLHHLLNKYPESFGESGLTTILHIMAILLAECKKSQLFRFLFEGLSALIRAVQHFDDLKEKVSGVMTTVWSHCVSTINSRQAEVEGYQEHGLCVMACMISSGLVSPTKEIWNLFLPTFTHPSHAAEQLLTSLIHTHGLPEDYIPSIIGAPFDKTTVGKHPVYSLRQSLITWFLPVVDTESGGQFKTSMCPVRLAKILYALTLQDPSVINGDLDHPPLSNNSHSSVLEITYLKLTFDQQSRKRPSYRGMEDLLQEQHLKEGSHLKDPHVSVVVDFLVKHILMLCNNLEQQTAEFLSWFSCLLTHLLYHLWEENTYTTSIQCSLKRLLGKMADIFVSQMQKEVPSGISSSLTSLSVMLTWKEERNNNMFLVTEFVRSCLPAHFVDILLDLASGKLNKKKDSKSDASLRRPFGRHHSFTERREAANTSRADVDFDMFDIPGASRLTQNNNSIMDFDEDNSLQNTEDGSVANQDISDFLKPESLTEVEQTRVICTEVLCRLTSYDMRQIDGHENTLLVKTEINIDSVNSKILQLISSEFYDPSQALHVHLLLTICKYFLTCHHEVSLKDIKTILVAFKQTAKEFVTDQQVCCGILSHLRYIIPHLSGSSDPIADELKFCRDVFLKFVSDFWQLSSDGTPNLKFEIAETLLDLLKYDPDCMWGHLQITDQQSTGVSLSTVAQHFPKLLSDGSIMLRTLVAESLKWLFIRQDCIGGEIFQDKSTLKRAFESVFELCSEILDIQQGNLNDQRWQDELHNRQATCLQSLLTIIVISPVCEKQCLLGLCQVVAEKNIPLDSVKKVLNIICQELKFVDTQSYLTSHLPYLIHNWLHQKMVNSSVPQFPYRLLGYDNLEQFVRSHKDLIVCELLVTKLNIADIHEVLDPFHIDIQEAFISALPLILTNVLPAFAAKLYEDAEGSSSNSSVSNKDFAKATECFTIVVSKLSEKIILECAHQKLGDIVVRVLSCLSIDKDVAGSKLLSMVYPESNPPNYSHGMIQRTLNYLVQNFISGDKNVTLIAEMAKTPAGIYQVLLSLSSLIWHEHRAHEQQRYLQMYGLFINMLLKELDGGLEGGWASVIRDVVNRLLIVLVDRTHAAVSILSPSYEEEVILTTLDILRSLCLTALQTCPEEMTNYIHRIIDTVAGIADLSEGICKSVVNFLTAVLSTSVDDVEELAKAMNILNPLPNTPGLAQLRTRVEKMTGESRIPLRVLENLLKVCLLMSNHPSQGLAKRVNQLTTYIVHNHKEIEKLTMKPEGILILKNILTELLKLVSSSHQEVASAAAACLGAIGPIDLQSLSFPQRPVQTSHILAVEKYKGNSYEKYCWLFHALDNYLLDKSLQVVKTAGDILKKVMATTAGNNFEAHYTKTLKNESFLFYYLHPFKTSDKRDFVMPPPPALSQTSTYTFRMCVDKSELWLGGGDNSNTSHEAWIKALTLALMTSEAVRDEILKLIGPMCALKSQFCEESLPFLIHNILEGGDNEIRQVLSTNISSFFHSHCSCTQLSSDGSAASAIYMNKQSIRTMLNVVQYLRKQNIPQTRQEVPQTAWDNNFWLDVNYLEVAMAALHCSANFSAVLFAEIWWDKQRNEENKRSNSGSSLSSQSSDSTQESQLDPLTLVSSQGEAGQRVQKLLLEAYRNIGDPDGIYGCGAGKLAHPMARVQTYLHEQQQEKALTTLDIEVSHNSSSVALLLQTVESCGADYILQWCLSDLKYIRDESSASPSLSSSGGVAEELEEFHYQAAWKLGQWGCHLPTKKKRPALFHQSLYQAMVSFKDGHLNIAKEALVKARSDVVKRFDPHVESCKSLYPFLDHLQCLTYVQQVLEILHKLNTSSCEELLSLFADSTSQVLITTQAVHFNHEKSLLNLMASVANILTTKGIKQGEALEVRALWSLAVGGRKARQYQLAEKAVHSLKAKVRSEQSMVTLEHIQLEEAKLFWERAEVDIAKNILKNLIGRLSKTDYGEGNRQNLYPETLCNYGNWLAETRSETPTVIIKEYLEKTVALMSEDKPLPPASDYTALEGYVSLARFADEQYQQIADHIRSPTFEDKQYLLKSLRAELKECQEFKGQSKYLKTMERTLLLDQQEIESLQEAHVHFLLQAVHNYLKCLRSGDLYNLKVFRVVALWFENYKIAQVNLLIKEHIGSIKTYKFLPLYYQLAARMSSVTKDNSNFQTVLMELMERVAIEHPHHTLWIILALAHAYKDDELLAVEATVRPRRRQASTDDKIEEERVQAAKCMLENLRQVNKKMADIVTNMEKLCTAYIELANWPVANKTNRNLQPLQKDLAILKIADCDNILLPSVELQVDPTGTYKDIISPVRFGTHYRIVGGINLPKIITCVGSDGRERTQLVKGQDDLRQDAVMQQVFTLVNELLAGEVEARRRQLKIRTYKVIPLSQKCGLLQWCEGTKPLGEYLIGSNGAHTRYRPNDWSAKNCREHLQAAGNKADQRLKAYQEICAKFKPVFHHFFMENFLEPNVWFEKRLAYTRSVATNSIVGYILGLGDRHLMNILIDLDSAEVVHIDLGIAFEQGRILPTPETVPFRLTRDIVDGMGITGVEGVFRRCCEKTMEVMKLNSESLLTVIQVLLYDPLSHWTLTPQQALAIQRKREQANMDTMDMSLISSGQVPSSGQVSSSGQVTGLPGLTDRDISTRNNDSRETQNKLAERTLLRLRQKLSGQEDGVPLSVTGQVNLLIQTASNSDNLSMLFAGWQPYL